jgi:putative PIN family toxin of toxin-antitoxin system
MRVVIDTNVLLSAALRNRDPEAVLLHVATTPGIEWIVSPEVLREYTEVLRRPKFGFEPQTIEIWARLLQGATLQVASPPDVTWANDPGDAKFVALALHLHADFLISGDRGLLRNERIDKTLIVTVAQFMRLLRPA